MEISLNPSLVKVHLVDRKMNQLSKSKKLARVLPVYADETDGLLVILTLIQNVT